MAHLLLGARSGACSGSACSKPGLLIAAGRVVSAFDPISIARCKPACPRAGVTIWFNTVYLQPDAMGRLPCAVRRQINADCWVS